MKQKAFTLTELLGVIVIIGILLILIVPGIINRLSNSGNKAKNTENELIYNAADQYIRENPSEYPPGKSGRYCITIQSLIDDGKLAAPVTDVNTGKDITHLSVMVTIYSTGNTDHELKEGEDCKEIAALPMIDFKVEPKGSSWVKQRKVTIIYPSIEGDFEASHRIDGGSWTRDSSADKGGNIELTFKKIGRLEARLKGGNIISSKINIVNVDSEIPVISKVAMGSWSNGKNKVNITAKDNISGINGLYISTKNQTPSETASGWISVSSDPGKSKTFTRSLDLGTYYIWVKDKAGNISKSGTSIKVVDTIKPTCKIADSGTKGNNNWYKGNVTLKMTTVDKESGVASYGMNTSNSATYNGTTQMVLTYDSKSATYYGFVKDRGGNVGTCSKTVKRDTVAPSCSLTSGGTVGNNSWYRGNITISFKSRSDATSGISNYGITTSTSASYNGKTSVTQTGDTKGTTFYGYVKDAAGNTSKCSLSVKKDTKAPSCSLSLSGTSGNNSWYRSNVKVSLSKSDSTSGVSNYGVTTSGSATYNGSTSATQTADTKSVTYYGYVRDAAGNTSKCSKTFKKDSTAPSCSLTRSGTVGNNSWYRSNVKVSFSSKSDSTSGVSNYGIGTSTSASYNSKNSATQTADTSGITYYGYVKDAAGNTNRCSTNFKKDSTKPTLSYTLRKADGGGYNSGDLSDQDVIRNLSPKDNLSGIDRTEFNTGSGWTLEGNVATHTYTGSSNANFRTIDKAGNISDEINLNIRIEKDPDKDMTATCGIECGPNGNNCYVYGQNFGARWRWDFSGAGSGINQSTMRINYSTPYVIDYLIMYYPENRKNGGRAEWGPNWILFGRAYANQYITGTACSNRGKCKNCTVY